MWTQLRRQQIPQAERVRIEEVKSELRIGVSSHATRALHMHGKVWAGGKGMAMLLVWLSLSLGWVWSKTGLSGHKWASDCGLLSRHSCELRARHAQGGMLPMALSAGCGAGFMYSELGRESWARRQSLGSAYRCVCVWGWWQRGGSGRMGRWGSWSRLRCGELGGEAEIVAHPAALIFSSSPSRGHDEESTAPEHSANSQHCTCLWSWS
jgi:hypothetical protein